MIKIQDFKLTMHLTSRCREVYLLPTPAPCEGAGQVPPAESSRSCEESPAVPGEAARFTMTGSKGIDTLVIIDMYGLNWY